MRSETSYEVERSVLHMLHRASQCANQLFDTELAAMNLTARQYVVLTTSAQNKRVSQIRLSKTSGIDRSTMTDVIQRMVAKGWLQRSRGKRDSRAYAVSLTKEGVRVLERTRPIAKRVDEKILGALPAKDRAQFLHALNAIAANARS